MVEGGGSAPNAQGLAVVPEQVRAVGNHVYELAEALRSALESAGVDVDAVLTDGWTGSSAAEFAEGWTDVRDGGMTIMRALTAMAERLGVTAETYTSQDQSTASAMGGSSLDLP